MAAKQTDAFTPLVQARAPMVGQVFLAMSIFVVGALGVLLGVLHANYKETELRALAITGNIVENVDEASALWFASWDAIDAQSIGIYFHVPLNEQAQLPVGVDAWPEPGSIIVSPAISEDENSLKSVSQYGRMAGNISSSVLASPTEKLVYVFPDVALVEVENFYLINGYGGQYPPSSEVMNRQPLWIFSTALVALIGLGAIPLLLASISFCNQKSALTNEILYKLGISRRKRFLIAIRPLRMSIVIGVSLVFVLIAIFSTVNVRVPFTGYEIVAIDVWSNILYVFLISCVGIALGLLLVAYESMRLSSRLRSRYKFSPVGNHPIASGVFVTVLLGTVPLLNLMIDRGLFGYATPVFLIILIVLVILFPFFMCSVSKLFGLLLSAVGRKFGKVTWLVGGRQLQADPRFASRTASVLALILILVTQVQLWTATLNQNHDELIAYHENKGRILVSDSIDERTRNLAQELTEASIPWVIVLFPDDPSRSAKIYGEPSTIVELGFSQSTGATIDVSELGSKAISDQLESFGVAQVAAPGETWVDLQDGEIGQFAVFQYGDELINRDLVLRIANQLSAPPIDLDDVGEFWAVGAETAYAHSRWVGLFGALGSSLLIISVLLKSAVAALRSNEDIGPLSAIAAEPGVAARSAAFRSNVPTVLGLLAAIPLVLVTSYPHVAGESPQTIPWSFLLSTAISVLVAQVFISHYVAMQSEHALSEWRPGSTDLAQYL